MSRRVDQVNNHLSSFRYTLPGNQVLTLDQRKQYEKDGFFIVRGLIKRQELTQYNERFLDYALGRRVPEATMLLMKDLNTRDRKGNLSSNLVDLDGEFKLAKLQDFQVLAFFFNLKDDPVLFSYCQHPDILKYVTAFTGPNAKSMHTMVINKPPDVGVSSIHPMHQDLHYFPFR
jgi:phytanoyl-CoA hydroxylase